MSSDTSSNIVEWLEETAWNGDGHWVCGDPECGDCSFSRNLNSAAAEIKRLRSILATVSEEREVYRNAQISTESGYHAERALADQLAEALRSSEERLYSHMFHDGVVTDKVREYVSDHHSLIAWQEARRER
jgi:hypothetical protein